MDVKTNITETTSVSLEEEELFGVIKSHLKSKGVKNTDKHAVIDFKKTFQSDSDRWICEIVINKYS